MTITTLNRQLHLVDIENLLGDPRPKEAAVLECLKLYGDLVDISGPNQVVVACNHGAAPIVGCCLGEGPRLLVRSGLDGADMALMGVLNDERLASGDGIFTTRVAELTSAGMPVTVVARKESLSARLRLAATGVVFFEAPQPPTAPMEMAVAA